MFDAPVFFNMSGSWCWLDDGAVNHDDATYHAEQPPDSPLNLDSPSRYNGQCSVDGEYLFGALEPGIDVGDSGDCLTHLDDDEFIGASEDILYREPLPSTSSPPLPQEWQPSTLNPHYLTPGTGHCGSVFLGLTPPGSSGSEAATPSAISTSDHANSPSESIADYPATRRVPKSSVASPSLVAVSTSRRINKSGKLYWCTEFPPCNASFTSRHNLRNHIKSHLGEEPYQCRYCPKRSVTKHVINRHMRTCKSRPSGA